MRSIRWQLPLSYALIAFVASVTLGAVLMFVLYDHYERQERWFLENNAEAISEAVGQMWMAGVPTQAFSERVRFMAMLPQTRVIVRDENGEVVIDSGDPAGVYEIRMDNVPVSAPMVIYEPSNGIETATVSVFPAENAGENVLRMTQTAFGPVFLEPAPFAPADVIPQEGVVIGLTNVDGTALGSVTVSGGPAFGDDILQSVLRAWVISGVVAVTLAAVVGWFISRRITDPLVALTETTKKMAAGDYTARADVRRRDEPGVLAEAFNEMAHRVEISFTTLRRFVADAAHEICTPLTALRTNLELSGESPHIKQALNQVAQLETLTRDLLDLSRIEAAQRPLEPVDVVTLIEQISPAYASRAEQADVDFQLEVARDVPVIQGSRSQLKRMVCNLLDNAIKFTPAGGVVRVVLRVNQGQVELMVQDTGIGIPDGDLPYLFERFRRGSNTASYPGSGLGLAIVKAIAAAHQAQVSAESGSGGTTIRAVFRGES